MKFASQILLIATLILLLRVLLVRIRRRRMDHQCHMMDEGVRLFISPWLIIPLMFMTAFMLVDEYSKSSNYYPLMASVFFGLSVAQTVTLTRYLNRH